MGIEGTILNCGSCLSSNLQNIKGYADANEILLFSCCSTSPLLAISGE